ncbi:MAG TPA: hypothetical protein VMB24_04010 [Dehalococcoidales bacterium]|nr:hypothetical protein [Dehalococcoidales bacterium]
METTRLLFQLQELDSEIDQKETMLASKTALLGNRDALDTARQKLDSEQKRLEEFKKARHDAEWQVDDVASKIKTAEKELYGGKVTNPKELSNLQHEINNLKTRSGELQDKALGTIDAVEAAEKSAAAASAEFKTIEENWKGLQEKLAVEIEQLKAELAELKPEREEIARQVEAPSLALYERIRKQKKPAVAKVEQGICRACRISLSASAIQRARSGQPVQCSTCGRILYI